MRKSLSRGAFQCPHVIGLKQTRGIKNVTLKAAIRGCRGLLGREVLAHLKTRKSNPRENSGLHHSEKRNIVIPLLHCVMNKMK